MTALAGEALEESLADERRVQPSRRKPRRATRWVLPVWTWIVILWLSAPIIVMIVFGFNNGNGRAVSTRWNGFTVKWYEQLFAYSDLTQALVNSVTIALLTTAIAVVLGTLMGVAMGRWRFRGTSGHRPVRAFVVPARTWRRSGKVRLLPRRVAWFCPGAGLWKASSKEMASSGRSHA